MDFLIHLFFLFLGLIILVKGSDFFVNAAASLARKLGVSEFVIGLTLVAMGTSLPELFSVIFASLKQESGLVMGNIIGANIANIALIIGIVAVISNIKVKRPMLERDGYILFAVGILLMLFILNGVLSRIEGVIFLLLFLVYTLFLFEKKKEFKGKMGFQKFTKYFFQFHYLKTIHSAVFKRKTNRKRKQEISLFKWEVVKDLGILVLSGFMIIFGAKNLINEAIYFAELFSIPSAIVGIIIAIGTTMPEMSVAITAVKKGLGNIAIGNAIGSCMTNTLLILGVASLINPIAIVKLTLVYTVPFMILMFGLLLGILRSDWKIIKKEGIILLMMYAWFLIMLFIIGSAL